MRSIFILVVFAVLLAASIGAPFTGVLIWTWLSLMTPQRLAAGFIRYVSLNEIAAIIVILGWFFSGKEKKKLPPGLLTWLWVAFMGAITITTCFALDPSLAWDRWDRAIKVMALGLLVAMMATDPRRVHFLVWVIALSLGYFGVKGGLFTILHGGHGRVVGPPSSSIADNNYFALALTMVLPLMYYLYLHSSHWLARAGLASAMFLTAIATLGTYSRGGLIGLIVMGGFFWWRSRQRILIAVLAIVVLVPVIEIMPQQWTVRMGSVRDATEQQTFKTRFDAWGVAYHLASDRPLIGGGFGATENADVYRTYSRGTSIYRGDRHLAAISKMRQERHLTDDQVNQQFPSDYTGGHAVHSIYFQVLADHGYLGFLVFLSLMGTAWFQMNDLRRVAQDRPDWIWARDLSSMMQVSMVAFFAAGASVSMCYYDLPYLLLGITLATRQMIMQAPMTANQKLLALDSAPPVFAEPVIRP